jgi:quinate dehydrogenase (quinone)
MNVDTRRVRPPRIFAVIVLLLGLAYLYSGGKLLAVGGSIYYVLAGIALVVSGGLLWRGHKFGSHLYGALLLVTLLWGLYEVGADPWALMPRVLLLAVLGIWLLTPILRRALYAGAPPSLLSSAISKAITGGAAVLVIAIAVIAARNPVGQLPPRLAASESMQDSDAVTDWRHYGNTTRGTRYAQLDEITPENAGQLKKLWHVRTGRSSQFKATPIQIGDALYVCTALNAVIALDADTGTKRWEFDPKLTVAPIGFNTTCRGVSYYRAPVDYVGACPEKIITGTTDARIIALNAKTGERCTDFGSDGEISLLPGIGEIRPNVYMVTSPPLIARNLIVVGTRVADNLSVNEPSGVIRAYNAVTGQFVWAWDMGRPGVNTEPKEGETYTPGTPNVWSMMSYDDALGLIYAPLGNATPDYFGAHRNEAAEKYASSIVALDVNDGAMRWSFQTVHHDIWDYDVPAQPSLVDLPQADGSVIPALVQATKRSDLWLLDRRNGKSLTEVVEKPVPQTPAEGEWLSKTQPFSVGMPSFADDLVEADMWGITPFDHMWCRAEFRKLRYEGQFTPQTVTGTLQYPGNTGGFNWGGVSIDEANKLLIVTPMYMPARVQLLPREEIPKGTRYLQLGTPYGVSVRPFLSPLAVPCLKPPYARMVAIDLQTQEVVWSRRLGTTNEMGPLGMKVRAVLPMGVPASAGSIITKGGVIFYGAGMDRFFRAFDARTGKELYRDYLPGSAQATPMSYRAPKSGKQIVVITLPNAQRRMGMPSPDAPGDVDPEGGHIIAYALPD